MPQRNSINLFGTTPYIVSTVAATGSYTTIQSAINAASAAGGGVVYIKPGTYFENLSIPDKISLTGATSGIDQSSSSGLYNVQILGVHTFSATTYAVSIRGITFGSQISSPTGPLITISPSTGVASVDFFDCIIDATINGVSVTSCISVTSTASGSCFVSFSNCIIQSNFEDIVVGTNSAVQVTQSKLYAVGGTSACVLITSATGSIDSSYNTYLNTAFSCAAFSANGILSSKFDSFQCSDSTGFYIKSSGAFGKLSYGDSIVIGSSLVIDPQIVKTIFHQNPDVIPTLNGQIAIGSTGNYPVTATLTAGSGIAITNAAGSVTIETSTGGFGLNWQVVNTSFTMTSGNGYIVLSGIGSNFTLPATSSVGSAIAIIGNDIATNFSILQTAGQQIRFGNKLTTLGASGSVNSTEDGSSIFLVCTVANTNWSVIEPVGNFNVI
jgi:Pectinesterase